MKFLNKLSAQDTSYKKSIRLKKNQYCAVYRAIIAIPINTFMIPGTEVSRHNKCYMTLCQCFEVDLCLRIKGDAMGGIYIDFTLFPDTCTVISVTYSVCFAYNAS